MLQFLQPPILAWMRQSRKASVKAESTPAVLKYTPKCRKGSVVGWEGKGTSNPGIPILTTMVLWLLSLAFEAFLYNWVT